MDFQNQSNDMSNDEYEILIRNLHKSHKKEMLDDKLLLVLFGISILLILSFIGGFISMVIK